MPSTIEPTSLVEAFSLSHPSDSALLPASLWSAVDNWQPLIEQQLERQLSGDGSDTWDALLAACDAAQALHENSRELIERLLAPAHPNPSRERAAYRDTHLQGAMADALTGLCLGTITQSEYGAITQCMQPLVRGEEPPQAYLLGKIELDDGEQQATWAGALTLTTLTALTDFPQPPRVLLYRFGIHGGWSAHATSRDLLNQLCSALGASETRRVKLRPATWSAFDDVLNDHLASLATLRNAAEAAQEPEAHERAVIEAVETLCVALNPSRLLALARVEETRRSLRLGEEARGWLGRTPAAMRTELAGLITEYASAVAASERLLRRSLPTRQAYVARKVSERLANEFALTAPCRIRLRVPLRVQKVAELIGGAAGPGTPLRQVSRPSVDTEAVLLEDLALRQIDEVMAERLEFLEVEISPEHHPQSSALKQGITLAWLRATLPDLDVAGNYERLLADTYLSAGAPDTPGIERSALHRPYALMLQMHEVVAHYRSRLDARGRSMVQAASSASTAQAWNTGGLDLTLRPAAMRLFDERTESRGSTLAGVVFIHDRASDATVLYLPQAPDGQGFSQYSSLDAAVEALEDLFNDQRLRRYLCGRALEGNAEVLESLVNQALARGYRNLIEARAPWPVHQSLTLNQFMAELGMMIVAHRRSSTSNADQVFDSASQSRSTTGNYIRMALGFVPFVGSLIALADAVEAGIEAGHAFAAGDGVQGLEATRSVLMSITDALFDFSPAGLATSTGSGSLITTARARQLRQGLPGAGRLRQLSSWSARRADEAFTGYERPVALASQPGTEGRWQGIYREPEGYFILRGSATYAVEWDASHHTWRLAQTRTRSYRQPVALDESGYWQTHGHLYGTLVEGGLQGGGGVQGYLADRLDPLWPDALRRLLPRWWTDAHFRRQQQLIDECQARRRLTQYSDQRLRQAVTAFEAMLDSPQAGAAIRAMQASTDQFVEAATAYYETLETLRTLTLGRRRAEIETDQSKVAATVCSRYRSSVWAALTEAARLSQVALEQRAAVGRLLDEAGTQPLSVGVVNDHSQRIQATLSQVWDTTQQINQRLEAATLWQRRVSSPDHRRTLHREHERLRQALIGRQGPLVRLGLLLDLSPRDNPALASWLYMRRAYRPARERFDRVARSAYSGESLSMRPEQRQRLQAQLRESSQALIRTIRRLAFSYPEQFNLEYTELLLEELQRIRDSAPLNTVQPARAPGQNPRRLFEAEGLLLVGEPVLGEPDVLIVRQLDDNPERWVRRPDRQWARAEQPAFWQNVPAETNASALARQAAARLEELTALRQRLHRYNRPHTLAADLEDLYIGESQDLEYRLRQLQDVGGEQQHGPLMQRLQQEADALRAEGRLARIAHCKASTTPAGGTLEYLIDANEVTIRRVNGLRRSGTTPRTLNWLQEYEVLDRTDGNPLFYAHFHYRKPDPRFGDFEVAHLKTPAQRYLTATAPNEPAIWRGEISRRLAARLFEPLFA